MHSTRVCACDAVRSVLMHRFWCVKSVVMIGVTSAFFFVPEEDDFVFSTSE